MKVSTITKSLDILDKFYPFVKNSVSIFSYGNGALAAYGEPPEMGDQLVEEFSDVDQLEEMLTSKLDEIKRVLPQLVKGRVTIFTLLTALREFERRSKEKYLMVTLYGSGKSKLVKGNGVVYKTFGTPEELVEYLNTGDV